MNTDTPETWTYGNGIVVAKGRIVCPVSNEKDGRLIAASPSLLRALQSLLPESMALEHDEYVARFGFSHAFVSEAARAAIALASHE
jgi:hypothetical protein